MQIEIYPEYKAGEAGPLYYVEFSKFFHDSPWEWRLFKRELIPVKQQMPVNPEWHPEAKEAYQAIMASMQEAHPWQLGNGKVNCWERAIDMNTKEFLKFMVDALNEKSAAK